MSDEEQRDAMDAFDQRDAAAADVEAHSLDALDQQDALEQRDATEEPPDVEGHSFDAMDAMDAMDQRD